MAVTNQQVIDFLLANPGISDEKIFEAMKTAGVPPSQMAAIAAVPVGDIIARLAPFLPRDQAVLLGDTWVQGNYRYMQSGEDNQLGPLESINIYKTKGGLKDKLPVGTEVQNYSPTGEFINTSKTKKDLSFFGGLVDALKDPVVLAALGGAAAGGLLSGAGTAATVGSTGLTTAQLAQLDLALGGAGGTAGATSLASALTTGATVPTLTNLTGGSGLLTGEAAGITAQSVADKLAADAAAQAKIAADAATAKAAADAAAAKAAADAKALADAVASADAATKAAAAEASAKAAADAVAAKAAADAAAATAAAEAAAAEAAAAEAAAAEVAATEAATAKAAADAATAKAAADAATAKAAADATAAAAAAKATADAAAVAAAATTLTPTQVTDLLKTGLTAAQIAQLFSTGATTASGLLQQATSREAALTAQKNIDAETAAAKTAAQFRPIGMTTRFGTSQFVTDPITGRLTSAGYTVSPESKAAQDQFAKLAESGITQAKGAQAIYQPLQTAAKTLFTSGQGYLDASNDTRLENIVSQYLGPQLDKFGLFSQGEDYLPQTSPSQRLTKLGEDYLTQSAESKELTALGKGYLTVSPESQRLAALGGDYLTQSPESKMLTALGGRYIAQSPEQVAQNYLNQQMALLQPGREIELANLQNRLQQQGRSGLSVAQGGSYGATTPELQALFNARAMQEAQLAAQAQQAGQQQVQFGAGLVGTGQQLGIQGQQFGANLIGTGQQLGIQGQKFGADLIGSGQQLGIQGQQFGSNLIGAGQQLGIQGQQFGIDALARQQALEQQRVGFGSGLLSQGAGLQGQYYAGQQAAYAPYTTALGQVQNLETAAQQPFQLGVGLGKELSTSGYNVGRLGLTGAGQSVALATGPAATNNPYASLLSGVAANPLFGEAAASLFTPSNEQLAINPYFQKTYG